VKSNGEKFIADFLMEHGIEYRYERAWSWRTEFLDGATYRPDFSILANGRDFILEHWAFDPQDTTAILPKHWSISASEYSKQIVNKRNFWKEHEKALIETHSGMLSKGRVEFEKRLKSILERSGIACHRMTEQEIVTKVFESDFTISRMAGLFVQFIQRAKKRGWSAETVGQKIQEKPDRQPRSRIFHELALRAYREYEIMLDESEGMDFDDLVMQATEEVKQRGASSDIHLGSGNMISLDKIKWILLDEYQDFSELYYQLLQSILGASPNVRLIAVGDDWQAINSFAGAELRFFERVGDYFNGAKSTNVTTNYRSAKALVAAGNRLMAGRGGSAKSNSTLSGVIEVLYLGDVWIEFRKDPRYTKDRDVDARYLLPREDGKNPSEKDLRSAQALKNCTESILQKPSQNTMLIARTNYVYGLTLKEFRSRLIQVLTLSGTGKADEWAERISSTTAHGSKGQESDTVIILDATEKQFPKIHPDNLLFALFGVTPLGVLEEERRLFYVAVSRAEKRLLILTEKEKETPFLNQINEFDISSVNSDAHSYMPSPQLGTFGKKISAAIKKSDNGVKVN
jgi:DNA helicase IV